MPEQAHMTPPDVIAHYRIVSKLGEGGMGAVYRARDTKLDRDVAIKVLPPAFAEDAARMARFEREAKVLASLNHPNIAAIYGIEQNAIVMELVEGEDLPVPLPLETALPYARQIAEALEAAHEKGIVHRDLKPANIRVTPQGVVKILDFGLAAVETRAGNASGSASQSPTLTAMATEAGTIMGTASYMSPEQASGRPVDKRADIWSFGVVLWEMLCGRRLFQGETVSHTLADVLRAEIDLRQLPATTPPPIRELVGRCLDRDLKTRLRDIGEARIAIARWLANPMAPAPPASAVPRRFAKLPWAVAIVALAVAAAGYLAWKPAPAPEMVRLDLDPPQSTAFSSDPAISPDGRTVAFLAGEPGKEKLWLRPLDAAAAHALEGTEGGNSPFWSPDGRYIGYCVGSYLPDSRTVMKVAVAGGLPQTLGAVPRAIAAAWSRDGVILVSSSTFGPLYRLSPNGGPAKEATVLDAANGETSHRWPYFLPDGRHFLFLSLAKDPANTGIYVGSLDTNERTRLIGERSSAEYASGYLLYVREQSLVAQPFDAAARRLSGEPLTLLDNIAFTRIIARGSFSVSENGALIAKQERAPLRQLTWLDRAGKTLGAAGEPGYLVNHRLSPDGKKAAMLVSGARAEDLALAAMDLDRGVSSSLAKAAVPRHNEATPVFSPDGARIAFSGVPPGIHAIAVDGGPESQLVAGSDWPYDWSHDGRYLVFLGASKNGPQGYSTLRVQPLAASGEAFDFLGNAYEGRFSPDGKWMAYRADLVPRSEIYLAPFTGQPSNGAGRIRVSPAGGSSPVWSRDGKELFYVSRDRQLMATPVRLAPTVSVGIPKPLFRIPAGVTYDVSPDGQRFLLALPLGQRADPPLTVLLNWTAGLKK